MRGVEQMFLFPPVPPALVVDCPGVVLVVSPVVPRLLQVLAERHKAVTAVSNCKKTR